VALLWFYTEYSCGCSSHRRLGGTVTADGSGSFSYTKTLSTPWTYTFEAKQEENNKWVFKDSATLTVLKPSP